MEEMIQELLETPFFKMILKEWSLHVITDQDPETFANMYMEWMRDPVDYVGRLATTKFLNFIRVRDWQATMMVIEPKLDAEVAVVFRGEGAPAFYRGWRNKVAQAVQNYWEEFLSFQTKKRGEEAGPRDWSPRTKYCRCLETPSNCRCKKPPS